MRRLIFVPLVFTLVACGGTSLTVPPPTASPRIPTPTTQILATSTALPATPTPRPLVADPTPTGLTCGTVEVRDNRVINPADAQAAEECFFQAYQRCAVNQGATMAVRESTDTTPYVDSTYGPSYFSQYTVRYLTVILGPDDTCGVHELVGVGPDHRTQAGTPIPWVGHYIPINSTCTSMTRSADGGLHVAGCEGALKTFDIPHP